ncbi:MAG: hypothetical protein U5J98_10250 [Halobacteriales archaeon]|nr:hypothetical protein [Halobacteriales archaeon]
MGTLDGFLSRLTSPHWLPYVIVGLGLPVGLVLVFRAPLPWPGANLWLGGLLLAVAVGATLQLIARDSGPGGRRPDF